MDSHLAIYILDSDEVAGIDTQPQHMWDFRMETIKFSVKQTYTTEDTAQLSIKQRQCAFPNEIKLMGEEIYSYTACTRECRMKNAMKLCSCVPFFFPIGTTGYVHCKIDELACISKHLEEIKSVDSCSCYLGCSNTVYEVEKLDNFGSNQDAEEGTLDCMFVSWPMVRYKREVLFGWVDLLVSFGGIAGLFLGFSLLSGVEILYYFTIRTCCMVVKEKKQLKKIRLQEKFGTSPKNHSNPPPYFISKTPTFDDTGITLQSGLFSKVSKRVGPFNDQRQSQPQPTIIKSPFGIEFIN
nr:sodium channel protein Nach-like [Leptinotarsa decemlineata]